jgi:hypothetical protein
VYGVGIGVGGARVGRGGWGVGGGWAPICVGGVGVGIGIGIGVPSEVFGAAEGEESGEVYAVCGVRVLCCAMGNNKIRMK